MLINYVTIYDVDLVPNAMFVPLYILFLLELHHCVNNIQDNLLL